MKLCKRFQTHWVDVSPHEVAFLWLEHQVVPPEGHDARLGTTARDLGQAVRVQPSTSQHIATVYLITLHRRTRAHIRNLNLNKRPHIMIHVQIM